MEMEEHKLKQRVQLVVLLVSCLILAGKFVAYFITHSVGILTDAMESIVNVVAGAISLLSLYIAARPKDTTHPFGHGKIELISASIEGLLIVLAGGLIIYEGIHRLIVPAEIRQLDLGIYIIAASGVVNYLAGWCAIRVGRKHNSMALVAEGKHLQSDSYSTLGLLVGLGLLYFTQIQWIDSAIAIVFGVIIIVTGVGILWKTMDNLLDKADMELLEDVARTLNEAQNDEWIDIHNAKILKYGSRIHLDCDLTIPWFYTITQGHQIADDFKDVLRSKYADRITFNIHIDPCNVSRVKCGHCACETCAYRQKPFEGKEIVTVGDFVQEEQEKESPSPVSP